MGHTTLSKLLSKLKPILKSIFLVGVIAILFFSQADGALAARSGGRMGGGSFRAPSRSYSAPSRSYAPNRGYGGGFGFPFLIPFFGFGGGFGGLFSILIVISLANFLVRSFRGSLGEGDGGEPQSLNPTVSVAKLQVGLLAQARELQTDLDRIALTANTESAQGRAQVLQESTLALLRHPEYFAYASSETEQTRLNNAEAQFNRWSLSERSKFSEETLSNYDNQLKQASDKSLPGESESGALTESEAPSEYIVVTLLVGVQGKLKLPAVQDAESLNQALRDLGGVGAEQLLAVEVLWTPQAPGDTLTADDLLAGYPQLQLV
ncbi:DUF1517 domain-containing protein [Phormidium yuhuli AB48]|uniref:DUF1517 domain-containing protein n=1 Tax=Phormidium yuhuli AB48 TaxID=2940671 RepID=A0ABY5ANR9_9CYAN|nr:DUF1517 domain-containing protein [Phormidium yuhuli]USR90867.1 DUF1517 domain-containing protein [Phormidium yuhuli AB48]